jgi:flagellar biosynthesis GTPase FlhF
MLVKLLKQMLEPHAAKISNTKELKSKCLNKDYCGLLLKGGTPETYVKDAVKNLLNTYPQVQFASIDSNLLYMTNLEAEYMPEFESGKHRFVLFRKVSGGMSVGDKEDAKEGRIISSILPLPESESFSFGSIRKLVDKALSQKAAAMKKIPALPQVKTRTKKLEEAERKKRERSQQQQQRKKQGEQAKPSSGGSFTANDGSKEGRRAERERRRREHQKNNPNYREKTPEEKAEMERKRRERMEEEAKKWNVAPEDLPPEGDVLDEGEDLFMEDETYVEYEDVGGDDTFADEDEDILDLD